MHMHIRLYFIYIYTYVTGIIRAPAFTCIDRKERKEKRRKRRKRGIKSKKRKTRLGSPVFVGAGGSCLGVITPSFRDFNKREDE